MTSKTKLWNRDFVAVCLSSFFLFMTFYILAVTLPIYVTDTLRGTQQQIGPVMTVFVIAAVLFRPLTGKWMDGMSRKRVVMTGVVIFLGCSVAYPFVSSYPLLLVLRFIHGIGFGIASTATGAVAVELVPNERKGEGIGYFSLFMSLAMVVGPFVGLTIMSSGHDLTMFGLCIAFAVLSFGCGAIVRIPAAVAREGVPPATGWRAYLEPAAIPISLTGSILAFSYGSITTFLSVYAKAIGLGALASYFFMVFAAMIVMSRPFTGRLFDRTGPHRLVYPGVMLFAGGMLLLAAAHAPALFLAAGALLGLGFGALLPSFQTIAVQAAPLHRRGLATGTFYVLFDTGYGVGSSVLGVVAASRAGYHGMYTVAGLVVALSALLYYSLHHRPSRRRAGCAEAGAGTY